MTANDFSENFNISETEYNEFKKNKKSKKKKRINQRKKQISTVFIKNMTLSMMTKIIKTKMKNMSMKTKMMLIILQQNSQIMIPENASSHTKSSNIWPLFYQSNISTIIFISSTVNIMNSQHRAESSDFFRKYCRKRI